MNPNYNYEKMTITMKIEQVGPGLRFYGGEVIPQSIKEFKKEIEEHVLLIKRYKRQ